MSRVLNYFLIVIAIMLTASSALAHHSFAMFDQSKTATVQGTVKDFRWTNPHVFIQLLVKTEGGGEAEWSIEMTSPEHLSRVGWRPGTLKPGDKVSSGNPSDARWHRGRPVRLGKRTRGTPGRFTSTGR